MSENSFEEFWGIYPKRQGANPKHTARISFDRALKGSTEDQILQAVRKYAQDPETKPGTRFVPMASTWLNQRRFEDYPAPTPRTTESAPVLVFVALGSRQWEAWVAHLGKRPPVNRQFGWYFPSSWPPAMGAT